MYHNLRTYIENFVNVSEEGFNLFTNKIELVQLQKNEFWVKEGNISQKVAFLNKGLIRHFYLVDGNERTEKFYFEQNWLGDYGSFLSKTHSLRNYQALEKSELFVLSFDDLQIFYAEVPAIEKFGRLYAEQLLIELHHRNTSFLLDSAEQKYKKLVTEFPELIQRVPQYLIAQYLGIKPETLSRIRKRLIDLGQ